MGTSGNFVVDFREDLGKSLRSEKKSIQYTNIDVIAIETIIWLAFYSLQLWRRDKETDPETVASIEGRIFHGSALWSIMLLAKDYGLDSKKYLDHRWRYYSDGLKESDDISTLFPSVIFKSVGKKNFDDVGVFDNQMETLKLNWLVVYTYANSFSIEKSDAAYGAIKSIVHDWRKLTGKTLQRKTRVLGRTSIDKHVVSE